MFTLRPQRKLLKPKPPRSVSPSIVQLKWLVHPYSGKLRSTSQNMNSPTTFSSGRPSFGGRRGDQALCQRACDCSLRAASLRIGPLPSTSVAPEKRLWLLQNKRVRSAAFWLGHESLALHARRGRGQANAKAHRRSEPRSAQQAALAERHTQCTHSPSVNLTRYGRRRLAAPDNGVNCPFAASRRLPQRSGYLKRYASPAESESKLALVRSAP